jgi:ArsR family transcriptional regulator, cadmium/lead-responsive transcriptional repressor
MRGSVAKGSRALYRLASQSRWGGRILAVPAGGAVGPFRGRSRLGQPGEVERMAMSFRALSDPFCLTLLTFLAAGDRTSWECAAYLAEPERHVRYRLNSLQYSGWVAVRRRGYQRHYRLADPRTTELMLLARALAADNSGALSACATLNQITPHPAGGS